MKVQEPYICLNVSRRKLLFRMFSIQSWEVINISIKVLRANSLDAIMAVC